jgi:hypothetical protein
VLTTHLTNINLGSEKQNPNKTKHQSAMRPCRAAQTRPTPARKAGNNQERKQDMITSSMLNSNDAYRNAFQAIARHALPFMAEDSYFTDLLYDAANAADLKPTERFYLLVRDYGTNYFTDAHDAMMHCGECSDGKAVLRIMRAEYDRYVVSVIYTREKGYAHQPAPLSDADIDASFPGPM